MESGRCYVAKGGVQGKILQVLAWCQVNNERRSSKADGTGTMLNRPKKIRTKLSIDNLESFSKMIFEQIFEKTIFYASIRNAISLVEISSANNEFLKYYSNDQMAATFEVMKFQREYLYQTFGKNEITNFSDAQSMGGRKDKINMHLYRQKTKEQLSNPYMVQQLLNPKIREAENKEKLQTETVDAIEKLSEYAL